MYGVFFMSETMEIPGVDDQTIHLFETEHDATMFVFDKLVEANLIEVLDTKFVVDGELIDTEEEALEAVREDFGALEFFHVYQAFDRRESEACK